MSFLQPFSSPEEIKKMAERKVSALSMEMVPRITRAQRMDALSTMSTVAGYKVVLLAANACGRFFPMLSTAAGTIHPAKAIIIGAGVAGLAAAAHVLGRSRLASRVSSPLPVSSVARVQEHTSLPASLAATTISHSG